MEFRILGPFEAADEAGPVVLAGGKQRAVLAVLLLHAGHVVSRDHLVDDLWGDEAPETAPKMVQILVSQLRKRLPDGLLRTKAPGYLVTLDEHSFDLRRFEELTAAGRAALGEGRADEAATRLGEALSLWRGPAFGEFEEPFAELEAARLEEQHVACLEERIEADLALGRHAELVAELDALVRRHPHRERLRGQLMLALYRSGRHAEALESYQAFRRMLDDELGIEPSAELKDLERRVLRQDAGLSPPARAAVAGPAPSALRIPSVGRLPEVRYAKAGELNVAYQVTGSGSVDLVLVPGFVSHLEKDWEEPRHAHFLERLGAISRLIRFDKRGTGLSDRPPGVPDLETRMDDVRAVMDAAASERAVLFGYSEGAPMAILFAATYPRRVRALVLYGGYAKRNDPDEDYPWAPTQKARKEYVEALEDGWGFENDMMIMCPSADEAMARWWGERCRAAASPGAVRALIEMNSRIDVRPFLGSIHVPTLVVHRGTDFDARVEEGRYIAERVAGARFVELPGADHFVGVDPDQILDVVEPFLVEVAGVPAAADPVDNRVLATILVTDIVGSTETVARIGDRAWAGLVTQHERLTREQLARLSGEEIDTTGDGVLALFDGPARAIRCASRITESVRGLGLEIRAGVHTGEVERVDGTVRGIAVHIGARIAAAARPGEVLVSGTVKDIVAGSGIEFEERGEHELAGVPGSWRLFAAAA